MIFGCFEARIMQNIMQLQQVLHDIRHIEFNPGALYWYKL